MEEVGVLEYVYTVACSWTRVPWKWLKREVGYKLLLFQELASVFTSMSSPKAISH